MQWLSGSQDCTGLDGHSFTSFIKNKSRNKRTCINNPVVKISPLDGYFTWIELWTEIEPCSLHVIFAKQTTSQFVFSRVCLLLILFLES